MQNSQTGTLQKRFFVILALALVTVCFSLSTEAIPAFARELGVKCQTCHFPNPPRLNNVGTVFRRMGFRLPDSDDKGNLVFKTHEIQSVLAIASMIANIDAEVDKNPPSNTESRSNITLGEVALFSAHALPDNLSYWLVFLPRNDAGEAELDFGEMQYNFGNATDAFHIRGGKFLTLWWQKVNDESLTLSSPLALEEGSPVGVGSFPGFGLGGSQTGGEFGYTHNRLVDGRLSSTTFAVSVLNGLTGSGDSAIRRSGDNFDFLAQGYHLFGSANSAGGFYYHGNTKFNGADPNSVFKDTFDRYGVVGSYWFRSRVAVLAGFIAGKDNSTELGAKIKNRGWFIESDASVTPKWSVAYRHDYFDPDTSVSGDQVRADTISTIFHPIDNILLTLEYNTVRSDVNDHVILGQIRLAY